MQNLVMHDGIRIVCNQCMVNKVKSITSPITPMTNAAQIKEITDILSGKLGSIGPENLN